MNILLRHPALGAESTYQLQKWLLRGFRVQRVQEAGLPEDVQHSQRVRDPEALVIRQNIEELKVGEGEALRQQQLLQQQLGEHAHGDFGVGEEGQQTLVRKAARGVEGFRQRGDGGGTGEIQGTGFYKGRDWDCPQSREFIQQQQQSP